MGNAAPASSSFGACAFLQESSFSAAPPMLDQQGWNADPEIIRTDSACDAASSSSKSPAAACAAVATALYGDAAAIVACLDNGSIGTWLTSPYEETRVFFSQGADCGLHDDDQVSCLSFEPQGLSRVEGGRCTDSRGRCMSVAAGTSSGCAVICDLDFHVGELRLRRMWSAHSVLPGAGLRHNGVAAIGVDGDCAVTGGAGSDACIWNCHGQHSEPEAQLRGAGGSVKRRIHGAHGGAVTAVATERGAVVTGGEDGVVKLWGSGTDAVLPLHRAERATGRSGFRNAITRVAFDPERHRLCTASEDCMVRMWDIAASRATRRFACKVARPQHGKEKALRSCSKGLQAVAFDTQEAPTRLASGGADGSWHVWDVRQTKALPVMEQPQAHGGAVTSVSLQGERLLSASLDGRATLWDLRYCPQVLHSGGVHRSSTPSTIWEVYMMGLVRRRDEQEGIGSVRIMDMCRYSHGACFVGDCDEPLPCPAEPHVDLLIMSDR